VNADPIEGIHIVLATGTTVIARVRDDAGIFDVTHGCVTGWWCSCSDGYGCVHVLAVQQVTAEAAAS